jgi:tetratricopeptide (TPR) repeat protein
VEPLYGRDELLARARLLAARARAGVGRLLLFTGEPGIGKSRLAEQVALEAAGEGATVAFGRCWEAGGAPAYWPWIQLFRCLRMDEDPFAGANADLAAAGPEARFASFDRAVQKLRALSAQTPLTLVLDDLHAADPPSLWLLLLLSRELPRSAILVLGAYRDSELPLRPEIARLLAAIAREAEVVPLPRLAAEHVAIWLRDAALDGAQASELYRLTEGHPLFVVEAVRLACGAENRATWMGGLAAVLDERLSRLSAETRAALEVGAVLGREFVLGDVAATAGMAPDDVHEALRGALASNLVVRDADADRFRFAHVLWRDRLYAELLPSARAALHVRAGMAVLARSGDAQSAIHHLFEGQSAGVPERIAEVALAAASAALSRLAFEEAVRLGRRALSLPGSSELPANLLAPIELVVAEALIRLGESGEGKVLCVRAAARAEQAQCHDQLARAALVYGTELATGTVDPHMVALLQQALAALDGRDSALHARLLARLAAARTPSSDPVEVRESRALARASLGMARRVGDRHTLLYALQFAATVGLLFPDPERFAALEETLELARALDQPLVLLHTLPIYATALLAVGERRRAQAVLSDFGLLLGESRQPVHRVRHLLVSGLLCALQGDVASAERLGSEARLLAQSTGSGAVFFLWVAHRLSLAQLRGQPELLATDGAALLALHTTPTAESYLAWALAGMGRHEEARERLRARELAAATLPTHNGWEHAFVAEACVILGDAELGEQIYPHALRAADRMFWSVAPGAILGPSARALGDLALLIGRVPEAIRHYDDALAFCEKMEAPELIERCTRARALALARAAQMAEASSAASSEARAPVRQQNEQPAPGAGRALSLQREGELWTVSSGSGITIRLKHGKGLGYLQYLVAHPGREVHVLELAGIEHRTGDAGPVLDARAKATYRARLETLREQMAEAERFGDIGRASRARGELDLVAEQLAGAVGLGGRDRRAASDVERTRINVQRRLKDAIERIAAADPVLGRYLAAAVKTGTTCVFQPL